MDQTLEQVRKEMVVYDASLTFQSVYRRIKITDFDTSPIDVSDLDVSKLIENQLLGIPTDPIWMAEIDPRAKYVAMGCEKLLTMVKRFVENQVILDGLVFFPELNGKQYQDLDSDWMSRLDNSVMRSVFYRNLPPEAIPLLLERRL